ncbi:hypothetical protein EMPS_10152 [Entomortierella parvispora]|uniref:Uncharacterized protein n=1 Tax=Entomortierella parvispora TaxID=205924 RepID=A0A9P3HJZ2_9FUNG|nr:hypothetical protein EMPS_10152 [Entomortierella parvispora]
MARRLLSISIALVLASTFLGQGTGAIPAAVGGSSPTVVGDPTPVTTLTVTRVISIYVPQATHSPAPVSTSLPSSPPSSGSAGQAIDSLGFGSYSSPELVNILRNEGFGTGQLSSGASAHIYAGTPLDYWNIRQQQHQQQQPSQLPMPSQSLQVLQLPRPSATPMQQISLPVQQIQIPISQQQLQYQQQPQQQQQPTSFTPPDEGDNWVVPESVSVPVPAPETVNYQPAVTPTIAQPRPQSTNVAPSRPTSTSRVITASPASSSPPTPPAGEATPQDGRPVSIAPASPVSVQAPESGPPSSPPLSAPLKPSTSILCYVDPSSSDTIYCVDGRVYKTGSTSSPQQGNGVFTSVHVAPDSPSPASSASKSKKKKRSSSSPMYGYDSQTGNPMNSYAPTGPQGNSWYPASSPSSPSSSNMYKRDTDHGQDSSSSSSSWPLYGLGPMTSSEDSSSSLQGVDQVSGDAFENSKYGSSGSYGGSSSSYGGGSGSHGSNWQSGSGSNYGGYGKSGGYKSKRQLAPAASGSGGPGDQSNVIPVPIDIGLMWDGTNMVPVPSGSSSPLPLGGGGGPSAEGGPGGSDSQVIPVPINVNTLVYPNGQMVVVPPGSDS